MKRIITQLMLLVCLVIASTTARALPFNLTDNPGSLSTQWYNLSNPYGYMSDNLMANAASPSDTDGFKWCFVKKDDSSFYIYNKAAGYWMMNSFCSTLEGNLDFSFEEAEDGFYLIDNSSNGPSYIWFWTSNNQYYTSTNKSSANVFKVSEVEMTGPPEVEESEVTLLKGIRSTGEQCINTGYTHKADTRVELTCNVAQNHDRNWEALFGARLESFYHHAFVFFSRTDGRDVPCYNRSGKEPRGSNFAYDQDILLTCGSTLAEWKKVNPDGSYGDVIASMRHDAIADDGKTPMFLFDLNTAKIEGGVQEDNSKSVMTLYGCRFYEGDNLVRDFVPAKYNDVVGLYERKTRQFLTTMTSTPFEEAEVEPYYSVTVNNNDGGVVRLDKNYAKAGEVVEITVTLNNGKAISKIEATTEGGEPVELIPLVGATPSIELLTNGTCDGTFNGWEYSTYLGHNWSIEQDEDGSYFWASTYMDCWFRQTVVLADKGITADMVDNGDIELTGSAEIKAPWEKDGKGSETALIKVYMYDRNNGLFQTAVILDDTSVFTEWTKFTKPILLRRGARKVEFEVNGNDAITGWEGHYGPCFRNLSLKYGGSDYNSVKYAFEMPADNVNLTVAFSDPDAITDVDADINVDKAIYDLSGRKVNPLQLHRGIYIHNGRKIVFK